MKNYSRRQFLRSTGGLAVATLGLPQCVPFSVFGKNGANSRVNLAIIGCGNQSTVDLPEFLNYEACQVVAVCDVNKASYGYKTPKQFLGREPQQKFVNQFYAEKTGKPGYRDCTAHADFREILARRDVDAVSLIVPDHWHAVMTIMAAQAGKDIYCQKPLTLTVRDGQEMIKAVRSKGRILQTGSQWRSTVFVRQACELIRNGRLGKIKRVESYVAENNFTGPGPGWKPALVPDGFDYNFWLGPAPEAPYHPDRCLYRFRFILDYSGGQTTNFGCHSNGIVQWALGMDGGGPVEFEDLGAEFPPKGDLYDTPTKVAFRARYASGTELVCKTDPSSFGVKFEGTEGQLRLTSKGFECNPASLKNWKPGATDTSLYVSENHYRNFIDCVRSRQDPVEPVEAGHRTANLCHLGNIAMRLKRRVRWDPAKEEIAGDPEASAMLSRPLRGPWKY